jgi:hypothetical protein
LALGVLLEERPVARRAVGDAEIAGLGVVQPGASVAFSERWRRTSATSSSSRSSAFSPHWLIHRPKWTRQRR